MALVGFESFQIAASGSTGSQTLSTPIGGATPLAVIIEGTGATVANTVTNHCRQFWGGADGANTFSFSSRSEDGQATSDCGRRASQNLLELINTTTNANAGDATLSSFAADQVNITWGTAAAAAFLLNVTVFYGDQLQVSLVEHKHSGTASTQTSITGLGFDPNLVMSWGAQAGGAFPATAAGFNHWMWHHGIAINQISTITQGGYSSRERDNLGITTGSGRILRNDSIASHLTVSSTGVPSLTGNLSIDSFDLGGITMSPSASSMSFNQAYLCLDTGENRLALSFQDLKTSTLGTGSPKKITTGWVPRSGRFIGTNITVA